MVGYKNIKILLYIFILHSRILNYLKGFELFFTIYTLKCIFSKLFNIKSYITFVCTPIYALGIKGSKILLNKEKKGST